MSAPISDDFNLAHWLESLGLGAYTQKFAENHITPEMLPTLSDEDLKSIGVGALGHRKQLLAAIAALAAAPAPQAPSPQAHPAFAPPPKVPEPAGQFPGVPAFTPPTGLPRPSVPVAATDAGTAAAPVQTPGAAEVAPPSRKSLWAKILASKFLFISIVAHVLFGLGATYYVVQRVQAKRKLTFRGGPPSPNPSKRALEHKVSMAKKKTGGAPPQAKRIVSAGISKVSLPEMPAVTSASSVVANMASGMGGAGTGQGVGFGGGMGGGMGGGGGGGGMSFFGFRGGGGFVGTFYDFKRDTHGKPNGVRQNRPLYTKILKSFARGSTWNAPASESHYTSKAKLSAKAFFFPAIADTEAGDAFQAKDTGPGMWVAHYSGSVTAPVTGRFRFVGWGDNVMIVGINGKVVLDASDIGYVDPKDRKGIGSVSFPKKGDTPLLQGEVFQVTEGQTLKIDILLGDEGGIYCAGLMLQKEGQSFGKGKGDIPELPLFLVGALNEQERRLYHEYLGEAAFKGPVFTAQATGSGSLMEALKKGPQAPK